MNEDRTGRNVVIGIASFILFVFICMWSYPHYNLFCQRMNGEAELAHAEFSKRIAVESAKAKKDSAVLEAEAEVERAKGVAKANGIIGDSLKDNDAYLKYLWITSIDHAGDKTVVYVPTEAQLPVLESTRHLELPKPRVEKSQ